MSDIAELDRIAVGIMKCSQDPRLSSMPGLAEELKGFADRLAVATADLEESIGRARMGDDW